MANKKASLVQQIEAVRHCLGRNQKHSPALTDAIRSLDQLRLAQQELMREDPDDEKVAELLIEIFV